MKNKLQILLIVSLLFIFSACDGSIESSTDAEADVQQENEQLPTPVVSDGTTEQAVIETGVVYGDYSTADLDASLDVADMSYINLKGDSIIFEGSGAVVNGSTLTITEPGVYSISGTLDDGQILVDSSADGTVRLILNSASISSSTTAPIYIQNADKAVITLADGTDNYVSDGSIYVYPNADVDEPNAAIFSNDDLTINGNGSLTVNANYNNGIGTDDDLKIISGSIMVKAVNDGIKGKDSVSIKDGTITINAGSDGLQSSNDTDAEKGTILIEGGTLNIIAGLDGIQAETILTVYDGNLTISSGGGSANGISQSQTDNFGGGRMPGQTEQTVNTDSMKGLKAGTAIMINNGVINIDSADDALHSNDAITINGGELTLTSGDDGMHADTSLDINAGTIVIHQSYEGIESAVITINGGTMHITASDDAINVAGGSDESGLGGRPGQGNFSQNMNYYLYINDGYLYLDAGGDGLDSNGSIDMNGGTVIVNGPTNDGNGALDYMSTFTLDGGILIAAGSSGMAMTPTSDSTQYSVLVNFSSQVAAGTMLHFETSDGQEIVTFVPSKVYQSILISTPEITNGMTLDLYYGGSHDGTLLDGLYTGGTYTAGTLVTSLDITSVITGSGMGGGGMNPGGGGGGGGRGR